MMIAVGAARGAAQPRAHVYLFRGLADVFSQGMDTLADELNKRGIYATSHSHTDWKSIADKAAIDYKDGKEGPIVIVGHSLGADAALEMADYLGDKGVPVALVVPFDATQSFPVPANVARAINFTQRDYAFMRPGPGFRGSITNVDLRGDPKIDHLNIDEAPKLHSQVITAVLAIAGGHAVSPAAAKKNAGGMGHAEVIGPPATPQPAQAERPANPVAPALPPPTVPLTAPKPVSPLQIPD
jgi:pimeloyl-ACP methyl ester carboxylesterase